MAGRVRGPLAEEISACTPDAAKPLTPHRELRSRALPQGESGKFVACAVTGSTIALVERDRKGRGGQTNLVRAGLHFDLQRRARSGREAALRQLGSDYN